VAENLEDWIEVLLWVGIFWSRFWDIVLGKECRVWNKWWLCCSCFVSG